MTFRNLYAAGADDPSVAPSATGPTNEPVTVEKEFGEGTAAGQYSLDGGETWQD